MASDGPGCEMAKTRLACARKVPAHMLMCKPHWYQVSYPTRQAVLDTVGLFNDDYYASVEDAVGEVLAKNS